LIDQYVFDVLHGEGGRTLGDFTAAGIGSECADDSAEVHAIVFQESGILDGDCGLAHDRGNTAQRDLNPVLVVEGGQYRAIGSQDHAALGQRRGVEFIREGLEIPNYIAGKYAKAAREGDHHQANQATGEDRNDRHGGDAGQNPS